jgi:AAA domain-containing protein
MRVAVSGAHGTGKSTLVAAFLERCPDYAHEPEAFETLGDEVALEGDEPTAEGLRLLLDHTAAAIETHGPGASVIFERSPVDYLAYAAASRSWPPGAAVDFLDAALPVVRRALRGLDLVVFLPVSARGPSARPDESPRFRKRVDRALGRALLDDEHDLFGGPGAPRVVALPPDLDGRLAGLVRLTGGRV